ncbi:hypothetical protein [Janthinobacterium sp.]|uniref:hypothetical protein n=1 Tax=Janthinobacterium sp. TaxID=1871054 RepID=UPI00293D7452|nr:hypothetical protein [Janthinobacterium sp.]
MDARIVVLCLAACCAPAAALQPLSDAALAAVRGGDGVSFDLAGFAMSGDARVSYTAAPGRSLYVEKLSASRSDSSDAFGDPYRLDVVAGGVGLADYFQLAFPRNAKAEQRWQFAYDWGVAADGAARDGGSVVVKDAVWSGGGLQFSTPRQNDGIAFGLALNLSVAELVLRPRGRADASEQMTLRGIRLGGVDADGNFNNTAWALADVATQPAVINALVDDSGPRLHVGIGWPDARLGSGAAPAGGLLIENISFVSAGQPTVDLGSSRIGSMQIQYLDVKFKR